jgi:hypothetical protein
MVSHRQVVHLMHLSCELRHQEDPEARRHLLQAMAYIVNPVLIFDSKKEQP